MPARRATLIGSQLMPARSRMISRWTTTLLVSLIWSTFTLEFKKTVTEPFGCLVKSKTDGSLYLVFRGSKSLEDFEVDIEFKPVAYSAPTPNPPPGILVARGWYAVYTGLVEALDAQLKTIGGKPLLITGHSLGSALATLAVPLAVSNGVAALHYNSASPMVGLKPFSDYYANLNVKTFRLVNTADTVPNFPPKRSGDYLHVGNEVSFNADYGAEKKHTTRVAATPMQSTIRKHPAIRTLTPAPRPSGKPTNNRHSPDHRAPTQSAASDWAQGPRRRQSAR